MDMKHKILKTAFELFLESGFGEVSVNEIIRKAGVTKGGFYHYFKSKEELIAEVISVFIYPYFQIPIDTFLQKIKEEPDGNVREELYLCYTGISQIPLYAGYDGLERIDFRNFQFLIFEGMKKYQYLANFSCEYSRRHRAILQNILEKGKREGVIAPDIDTEVYATTMAALRDGIIALYILDASLDANEKCNKTFESIWNDMKAS